MKKDELKLKILLVAFIFCFSVSVQAQAGYKIGVLAKRGAPTCMKKWGATSAYLSEKLGEKFTVIPLKFTAIEPVVKSGKVDFLLANPAFYVTMKKAYGVHAITTMINSRRGKALKQFGGVLFVRSDSNIKKLSQIKGKKFMCVKYSSFGGGHMVWRLLVENGIDPKTDFSAFLEGQKHDNVVLAVQNGTVDVGTVRSDTLERMQEEGTIKMSEFRIIHQIKDDFPFVHSTRLYPEWPMAACKNTSSNLARKVAAALKEMPEDSTAAKAAKIVGWTEPLDYEQVTECLKTIKYGRFGE
ncbi:MAG: PhnD/SsuA/transferrin family substrate-binding protein [Desulfobacterales bacterium]